MVSTVELDVPVAQRVRGQVVQQLEPSSEFGLGVGQDEIVGAQVGFRELREVLGVETVVVLGCPLGTCVDPAADDLERRTVDLRTRPRTTRRG